MLRDDMKFAVIGGGSWATAIVKMLCENVDQLLWYMRNEDAISHIRKQKHNPNYLSSVGTALAAIAELGTYYIREFKEQTLKSKTN